MAKQRTAKSRAPKAARTDVLAQELRKREREVIETYLEEHAGHITARWSRNDG